MSTTLLVISLILMLVCVGLFYMFTQQRLGEISSRLASLQTQSAFRSAETVRRERAYCHDALVVLEADLSNNPREDLTPDELAVIDKSRSKIKACIDELKRSGDWIGMPFDFEWAEMLDRLPAVNRLYRRAVAMAEEQLNAPVVAAPPPPPPPAPAKTTGRW